MEQQKILVVDDDRNLLELIQIRLEASDYAVTPASNEDLARELILENRFSAAVIDLQLVNQDGITLMEEIHRKQPDLPVIILTAHGSIESAVDAMSRGAFTYLTKPFDSRELLLQLKRATAQNQLNDEIHRLREFIGEKYDFSNIIARSESMQHVLELVIRIAATDSNVAIYGASGTGKELIAKALHLSSPRKDQPFMAINCAAIPESLLESELFGHAKGAFTGAVKKSLGLFARADHGTLFLDEIGDMPLSLQAKLLRVLQERTIQPLGSEETVPVDVRVIVATNKNLKEEVEKGRFREDLFYRIHVIPIELPSLKERKEDIPLLAGFFINKFSQRMAKTGLSLTPAAMQKLMLHDWPGNVRELENTIEYAMTMADTEKIGEEFILPAESDGNALTPFQDARNKFEKEYLVDLLKTTRGNVSKAATLAGKYRADLYNLMKKHGVTTDEYK
ncbi:MAG: sigma-54 dependent transcriptional regulator [Proteobacteria bacterium]|nr:sigma-54 dependent transcriptional regulator [Pseudomonadota bacterium]MBU1738406.1 sigma-54 dependent transcriptional regulator [Pseudomonadota bacterium]